VPTSFDIDSWQSVYLTDFKKPKENEDPNGGGAISGNKQADGPATDSKYVFDISDKKNYSIMIITPLFSVNTAMRNSDPYSVFKDHRYFHHIMYFGIYMDMNNKVDGSFFLWNSDNTRFVCIDLFMVTILSEETSSMAIWQHDAA